MKKLLLVAILGLLTTNTNAGEINVNQNVLDSLTTTQAAPEPKFPIMPKRVVKPTIKKVVVKKPALPKPTPTPVVKKVTVEQVELQKEFEAMAPVVTTSTTPSSQEPKTLELMPGAVVGTATPEEIANAKPTPVIKEPAVVEAPKKVEEPKAQSTIDNKVVFENAEAKLSDANKSKVDAIMQTFTNPKEDKIAITAYNLEDSANAFKQKRQALNHAMEIRNYLVSKGYNNSSLRVIGVKAQPEKLNVVEITKAQ